MKITTYGPGGYDPKKPNSNVIDERTVELPAPATDTAEARLATLEAKLEAVATLAAKADATAQEVAQAVKDAGPPTPAR